ncbi:zinc finger MYM-type protein 2 isoform X2 [Protopterus annectens]|uniref:zinc finger MYM-type protein 2 isoform X2 n=1 Tax=Protopterus annectens TaxID=7888 RepID=UPI001CFA70F8|nr:zinc finger MYM-type protein 2 isoform X2 [Protopterus annectens]
MATGISNLGTSFGSSSNTLVSSSSKFQNPPVEEDDDDDVVFVEPTQPTKSLTSPANASSGAVKNEAQQGSDSKVAPAKDSFPQKEKLSEPIVIDDEEDMETSQGQARNASGVEGKGSELLKKREFSTSNVPSGKVKTGVGSVGISTDPDSEIQIANVTTLDGRTSSTNEASKQHLAGSDMNLMITNVTSLRSAGTGESANGPQSANYNSSMQTYTPSLPSQSKAGLGTFNPGRINTAANVFQNGESVPHHSSDSWISQSASFPRNQKQPAVDSVSPVSSLPKPVLQSPSSQQPSKSIKVTCANCKKPLQKGQTAYQRKGSAHLFCSTSCLSAFSHKPAPKKQCTMCKKDITTMKGTIVAQVDSSESFQEFCSTACLSQYEDKQNASKGTPAKSRCTVCGKLTEIRHEVSFKNMTHKLCSDHCFNRYRMANGLVMNCCEHCGEYLPTKSAANHFLMIEGQQKRFCSQNCASDFKQKHGKLTPCTGCRTQCRYFDMTQCIGANGSMEPYCSTTCMNLHKSRCVRPQVVGIMCHFCKRNSLPQFQATMPDGKLYSFCSSNCVAKFQALSVQSSANGQLAAPSDVQLKCNYCKSIFCSKPEVLEWESKVYQFCSKICCDDYKKLHCIVTFCEYCQEEKTLHEAVKFSGVKRPFCSEGCKLLFKQDFARRLGLKCVTCNYCTQMCKKGAIKEIDGVVRDFCSEDCAKKFKEWYFKAARCDCCKTQGNLRETVQWRGSMKHFCDQHCLLRFYCQQNEPNLSTHKGPENLYYDHSAQTSRPKMGGSNLMAAVPPSSPAVPKDMKNKAVLCKPLTMTKATFCKPHMQTKSCQTEEGVTVSEEPVKTVLDEAMKMVSEDDVKTSSEETVEMVSEEAVKTSSDETVKKEYVPVPVPVPVYVPVPVHMYTQNTPVSVSLPVPVPVPLVLPTTLDSADKILETIEEMKKVFSASVKHPTNDVNDSILKHQSHTPEELTERTTTLSPLHIHLVKDVLVRPSEPVDELDRRVPAETVECVDELNDEVPVCPAERLIKEVPDGQLEMEQSKDKSPDRTVEDLKVPSSVLRTTGELKGGIQVVVTEAVTEAVTELEGNLATSSLDTAKELRDEASPVPLRTTEELKYEASRCTGVKNEFSTGPLRSAGEVKYEVPQSPFGTTEAFPSSFVFGEDLKYSVPKGSVGSATELKEVFELNPLENIVEPLDDASSPVESLDELKVEVIGSPGESVNELLKEGPKSPMETVGELKESTPSTSVEIENLFMSKLTEGDEKPVTLNSCNGSSNSDLLKSLSMEKCLGIPDVSYEPGLDLEVDFPRASAEELDTESEFLLPPVFGEEYEEPSKPRVKNKGAKKAAVSGHQSQNDNPDTPENRFPFNYMYGVNAWKHWVLSKKSEEETVIDHLKSAKPVRLKEDILSHTVDELNLGLAQFIKEVRRPNGETYAPDSIYYLCLGIQEYLSGNNRSDGLFTDSCYQTFGQELNRILRTWQPSILPDDKISSGKRKHEDDEPVFEQRENKANPSRCPVKIFECYLSKSPQSLKERMDVFYLQPESSISPDNPLWYSSSPLERSTLENMLARILLVKEIYDERDNYELDEDTE